jgi:hypothetical protein
MFVHKAYVFLFHLPCFGTSSSSSTGFGILDEEFPGWKSFGGEPYFQLPLLFAMEGFFFGGREPPLQRKNLGFPHVLEGYPPQLLALIFFAIVHSAR